jgi:bifunctional non-homologous end joining protein LigD
MAARKPGAKPPSPAPPGGPDRLAPYRAKRKAGATPEPFGGVVPDVGPAATPLTPLPEANRPDSAAPIDPAATTVPVATAAAAPAWSRPRLFCVQKHAATRLHYDFRLELGGVLRSWAVPRGPSLDPADKRMAMEVEDHPVEYADFEGIIPEGNYGAGEVIVWDKGVWVPLEDPAETFPKGKLTFELRGYKLRGAWHLFRIKGKGREVGKEWMLVKRSDAYAGAGKSLGQESIYSGLTLEELREGTRRAEEIRAELVKLEAPRKPVRADKVAVTLAETRDRPFTAKGWIFELKYDGYRVVAGLAAGEPRLVYRRGNDATFVFPEIARALKSLPFASLVLDGEAVVLDESGRPSFQRLQKRSLLQRRADIERASLLLPATYYAFDLLGFEDFDLRPLPLLERKRLLQRVLPKAGPLRYLDHIEEHGLAFYAEVEALRLEGLVAKKADSPYRGRRTAEWIKIRVDRTDDFVIVGYTHPEGSRSGFGALHLAQYAEGKLVYAGRAGSGFDEAQLETIREALDRARLEDPPCVGPVPKGGRHTWVEPRLVAEVRFKEWTDEGLLRQPVFLRLRDDKRPEECVRAGGGSEAEASLLTPANDEAAGRRGEGPGARSAPGIAAERKVPFTNLKKVFWPDEGYTKGDLIEYYRQIAPYLLPYLEDRLLVLTRYPDGIQGKSFFQKDAPGFAPGWLRTERIWSEHAEREIDYFVVENVEGLLYIINLGTIPLHIWASRIATIGLPDWCILDLDPKGAPFTDVVKVAKEVHALAEEMEVPSYLKTSGSSGLHVLIPLGGQLTFDQCKSLGELVARVVAERQKEIATTIRLPQNRGGRVYVDFLQNGHGKLLAAPFSARPVPRALVSTPLRWAEAKSVLDMSKYTIATVPERMARLGEDPLRPVLSGKPDLVRAIARLSEAMGAR